MVVDKRIIWMLAGFKFIFIQLYQPNTKNSGSPYQVTNASCSILRLLKVAASLELYYLFLSDSSGRIGNKCNN